MDNILYLRCQDYFISPQNTVTVEKRNCQEPFAKHYHEFDEIIIVTKGNGLHIWDNVPYPITYGDLLYIHAQDRHSYQSSNNLKLINILYCKNKMSLSSLLNLYLPNENTQKEDRFWRITPAKMKDIVQLINLLESETKNSDPRSIHIAESYFLQLIISLSRFRYQISDSLILGNDPLEILFRTLHNSINKNFHFDEFCEKNNVNNQTLRRAFKNKTGMTISNYLQQLRLCHAINLLCHTSKPINTIAFECGYNDSNYFATLFKKASEYTPSEYRQLFSRNN